MCKLKNDILKDKYFISKLIFISLLIILASVFFFSLARDKNFSNEVSLIEKQGITIILDAGHGGKDSGANVGDVCEKTLNLQIVKKIKAFLSLYDIKTVLTRESDYMLAEDSSKYKKRDDLYNRSLLVNNYFSPIFVSIHMNKFPESKYKGLQVFYSANNSYSEALALRVQANNCKFLESDNTREVKKSTSSIYLLDVLSCPAILVECGFLSNPYDMEKLNDEEYQNKLSFVIANSILEYIKLQDV